MQASTAPTHQQDGDIVRVSGVLEPEEDTDVVPAGDRGDERSVDKVVVDGVGGGAGGEVDIQVCRPLGECLPDKADKWNCRIF